MNTLARRLTALWVSRDGHDVVKGLNQHLVFVAFHIDVTDRVSSERAGSDVALSFAFDGDITRSWHSSIPIKIDECDYNERDNARGVPAMEVNKNKELDYIKETKSKELLRGWAKNCSLSKNWPKSESNLWAE